MKEKYIQSGRRFIRLPAKLVIYGMGCIMVTLIAGWHKDVSGYYASLIMFYLALGELFEWLERGAENIRKQ